MHLAWPTSIPSSAIILAIPINQIYCWPCALFSCTQLANYNQVKVINKQSQIDADVVCGICPLESSSFYGVGMI